MFVESPADPDFVEMDKEGLALFNAFITQPGGDARVQQFVLHAVLAGAQFHVEVAKVIVLAIADTIEHGVDETLASIRVVYDMETGAERVEEALASGTL